MAMPREQKVAVKNLFEIHLFEAVIRQVTKRLNCAGQFLQDTESISLQEPITSRFIFVDGAVSVRCNQRTRMASKFCDFSPNPAFLAADS